MATIYQREGGTWWATHTFRGKRERVSLDSKNQAVARERMIKWVAEREGNRWGDAPTITFDEGTELLQAEHFPRKKPKTRARYKTSLIALAGSFEGDPLVEIDEVSLEQFVAKRLDEDEVMSSTVIHDLMCLSAMFNRPSIWKKRRAVVESRTAFTGASCWASFAASRLVMASKSFRGSSIFPTI